MACNDFAPLVGIEDSRDNTDLVDVSSQPSLLQELTQSISDAVVTGPRLEPIGLDNSDQSSNSQRSVPGRESLYSSRSTSSASSSSKESVIIVCPLPNESLISNEPDGQAEENNTQSITQPTATQQGPDVSQLSQYSLQHLKQSQTNPGSTKRHALHNTLNEDSGSHSLLQHSNKSSQDYLSGRLSDFDLRRNSFEAICQSRLSEYPLENSSITTRKSTLSQYPLEDTFQKSLNRDNDCGSSELQLASGIKGIGTKFGKDISTMASGESSDALAMFSTRPGTAIEAEAEPDVKKSRLDEEPSLAASIKYQHTHRDSDLGDTLLQGSKEPVLASTPFSNTVTSILASGIYEPSPPKLRLRESPQVSGPASSPFKAQPHSEAATSPLPDRSNGKNSIPKVSAGTEASGIDASDLPEENAETSELFYPVDSVVDPTFTHVQDDQRSLASSRNSFGSASSIEVGSTLKKFPSIPLEDIDKMSGQSVSPEAEPVRDMTSPMSSTKSVNRFSGDHASGDDGRMTESNGLFMHSTSGQLAAGDDQNIQESAVIIGKTRDREFDRASSQDVSSVGPGDKSSLTNVTDLDQQSAAGGSLSENADNRSHISNISNLSVPSDAASLEQRVQKLLQEDDSKSLPDRLNRKSLSSVDSKSEGSLSDRVAAILAGVPPQTVGSDISSSMSKPKSSDTDVAEDSEQEEIERIAGEYRAVLREHMTGMSDSESGSDSTRQNTVEIVTNKNANGQTQYLNASLKIKAKDAESDTDDTLDHDVRKILSKYGRSLSDSEDDRGSRRSRKQSGGSVTESEDMTHRVNSLLYGRPGNMANTNSSTDSPLVASGTVASYLYDDPAKSMSLPMDLVGTGASQEAISKEVIVQRDDDDDDDDQKSNSNNSNNGDSVISREKTNKVDYSTGVMGKSDYTDGVLLTLGDAYSKPSSRTSSLAGSVDLDNLTKDLDEMEAGLESLKEGSRRGSETSQRSSEEIDMHAHNRASSKGFTALPEYDPSDIHSLPSVDGKSVHESSEHSSYYKTNLLTDSKDANYHSASSTKSSSSSKKADLGIHALLTSNVIPLDVALDIVHGYDNDPLSRSRSRTGESDKSGFNLSSHDSRRYDWSLSGDLNDVERELKKYREGSFTDRNLSTKSGRSYPEKVADIMKRDSPTRQAYGYLSEATKQRTTTSPEDSRHKTPGQSFNVSTLSSTTPIANKPFSALGNFKSLYSSHVDKVSMEMFDKSVELHTPYRRHLEENLKRREDNLDLLKQTNSPSYKLYGADSPIDGASSLGIKNQRLGSYDYYGSLRGATESVSELLLSSASGQDSTKIRSSDRSLVPESSAEKSKPTLERHTPQSYKERRSVEPSDTLDTKYNHIRSSKSFEDKYSQTANGLGTSSAEPLDSGLQSLSSLEPKGLIYDGRLQESKDTTRSTSPGARLGQAGLRPYRPIGSQELYYVESGTEDGMSTVAMSETTVESTHIGSDDAHGPKFPTSVLGTRVDSSTSSSEGIYHKPNGGYGSGAADNGILSTIQEQPSFDSRDTESGKSRSEDSEKSKKEEEKERSVQKAQDWVKVMGEDGTPRDPEDKETPRGDVLDKDLLQEEIQPQDSVDANITGFTSDGRFGTPQKTRFRSDLPSYRYDSLDADKSGQSYARYPSSGLPTPAMRLSSDESISPVLPVVRDAILEGSRYDPATSSLDYGLPPYHHSNDSYSLTDCNARRNTGQADRSNVSFSPLRMEQDTDELLEIDPEEIPGKSYPSTPHPRTGKLSLDPASTTPSAIDPRLPQKYHFSDGTIIYRSNLTNNTATSAEQPSVLSDQLARFDDNRFLKSSYVSPDTRMKSQFSESNSSPYRPTESTGTETLRDLSGGPLTPEARYDEARLHERMRYIIDRLGPTRDPAEILSQFLAVSSSTAAQDRGTKDQEAVDRIILQELARQEFELAKKSGQERGIPELKQKKDQQEMQQEHRALGTGMEVEDTSVWKAKNISQSSKGVQVDPRKSETKEQATTYDAQNGLDHLRAEVPRLRLPSDASDSGRKPVMEVEKNTRPLKQDHPDGSLNAAMIQREGSRTSPGQRHRELQLKLSRASRESQSHPDDQMISQNGVTREKTNSSVRFSVENRKSQTIEQPRSQPDMIQQQQVSQGEINSPLTRQQLDVSALSKDGSNMSNGMSNSAAAAKKTAYLIKDETLASVPEDSTLDSISSDFTTSSYESADGRVIMKTTKRHLPDDPKLLRLQHKILKQKEKYKHDRLRELKRKEKIAKLERVLAERNIVLRSRVSPEDKKSSKTTSTPASKHQESRMAENDSLGSISSDSTTLTLSEITGSSTLTGSSLMSESNILTAGVPRIRQKSQWEVLDESHKCTCKATSESHKARSPTRKPIDDKSRNVSTEQPTRVIHRSFNASYMEFDKPASTSKPKRSKSRSPARHRDIDKENKGPYQKALTVDVSGTTINKRDFGQTCPTPMCVSPAHELTRRDPNTVTMVSQAVQTHRMVQMKEQNITQSQAKENQQSVGKDDCQVLHQEPYSTLIKDKKLDLSQARKKEVPKSRDNHTSIENRLRRDLMTERDKISFNAGQCGLSWFIPLSESRPWRQPLRERQAYAASLSTWMEEDHGVSSRIRDLSRELHRLRYSGHSEKLSSPQKQAKTSLQEAFENHMQSFISSSRERQRIVSLRAEERRIQELHDAEREKLFAVQKKMEANLHAVPISELHFNPQRRKFSRKEMIEQTKRKYEQLPEVKQQKEEQKKRESYRTNRLKAKLYKQKIQNFILNKRDVCYH